MYVFCQKVFSKEATCDIWTEYQGASTMDWNMYEGWNFNSGNYLFNW